MDMERIPIDDWSCFHWLDAMSFHFVKKMR